MQLFTVGLHELNLDGTNVLDSFGRVMKTYTNLDILSNARVMTGFSFTGRRGNVEELFRSDKSRQDPLRIEVDRHDFFPKSSLDGGWLGDRYPLCVDLPMYPFLKLEQRLYFEAILVYPQGIFIPCIGIPMNQLRNLSCHQALNCTKHCVIRARTVLVTFPT